MGKEESLQAASSRAEPGGASRWVLGALYRSDLVGTSAPKSARDHHRATIPECSSVGDL